MSLPPTALVAVPKPTFHNPCACTVYFCCIRCSCSGWGWLCAGAQPSYCLLVSDLGFGGATWNPLATTLLAEYVAGSAGDARVRCGCVLPRPAGMPSPPYTCTRPWLAVHYLWLHGCGTGGGPHRPGGDLRWYHEPA